MDAYLALALAVILFVRELIVPGFNIELAFFNMLCLVYYGICAIASSVLYLAQTKENNENMY